MDIARRLIGPTEELLQGFWAVVVNGPRQSGKSTLLQQVQRDRGPVVTLGQSDARGQCLLAGSTRFLSTRTLSETLTGRIGLTELLPVSMGERLGRREDFLDAVFSADLVPVVSAHRDRGSECRASRSSIRTSTYSKRCISSACSRAGPRV